MEGRPMSSSLMRQPACCLKEMEVLRSRMEDWRAWLRSKMNASSPHILDVSIIVKEFIGSLLVRTVALVYSCD